MARRDALRRLANTLLARRAALSKKLSDELASLREYRVTDGISDSADAAFEADSDDMSSRVAELEDRELRQIDRVLVRLKLGAYGTCEGGSENCQKKIPVARLEFLPYTSLCIHCERERERYPDRQDEGRASSWSRVVDAVVPREVRPIAVLELELSGKH